MYIVQKAQRAAIVWIRCADVQMVYAAELEQRHMYVQMVRVELATCNLTMYDVRCTYYLYLVLRYDVHSTYL